MTDSLDKLFSSTDRVKLLRLFLFNPRLSYSFSEASSRARVPLSDARKEITLFSNAGVVRRSKRSSTRRFVLRDDFKYLKALQLLLINAPARGEDIVRRLRGAGGIKFVALSGVFMGERDSTLDLLLVGDRVSSRKIKDRIKRLEAELGRELQYTLLSTSDFNYRLNMNDKLLRDVLDYSHRIVLDRINTGLK